jgi:uncharacterized protein (TIRG00374 family)
MRNKRTRKIAVAGAKIAVSAAACAAVVMWADPHSLLRVFASVKIHFFALGLVLAALGQVMNAWKVSLIIGDTAGLVRELTRINFVCVFFANFMPGIAGQDAVRVFYLGKKIGSFSAAGSAVLLDRISGYTIQCMVAAIALIIVGWRKFDQVGTMTAVVTAAVTIGTLIVALVWVFINTQKIGAWLRKKVTGRFGDSGNPDEIFGAFGNNPWRFLRFFSVGLVYYCTTIVLIMVLTHALGSRLSFFETALVLPLVSLGAFLPVSVNGWGITEWIFSFSYVYLAAGKGIGLSVSLLLRVLMLGLSIVGWILLIQKGEKLAGLRTRLRTIRHEA